MWPSETLVRLFKGDYIAGMGRDFVGKSVLDISFGAGNNLGFLHSLGLDCFGTEVTQEICDLAIDRFKKSGIRATLKVGTNKTLPFEDNKFDFLVSWNVLHYEDCESDIIDGIHEYKRVLKPGGRFFLSTTGPDHQILENSKTLGCHLYEIGLESEFRKGQVYFYFDAPNYIHHYFGTVFKIGRAHV